MDADLHILSEEVHALREEVAALERERDAGKSARIVADTVKRQLLDVAREADCAPPELVNTIRRLRRERDDAVAERDEAQRLLRTSNDEVIAAVNEIAAGLGEAEHLALADRAGEQRRRADGLAAELAQERERTERWASVARATQAMQSAAEARAEKAEAAVGGLRRLFDRRQSHNNKMWEYVIGLVRDDPSLAARVVLLMRNAAAGDDDALAALPDAQAEWTKERRRQLEEQRALSGTAAIAAAHDARVAAEALESGADALDAPDSMQVESKYIRDSRGFPVAAGWLRARAAELRAGGESVEGNDE